MPTKVPANTKQHHKQRLREYKARRSRQKQMVEEIFIKLQLAQDRKKTISINNIATAIFKSSPLKSWPNFINLEKEEAVYSNNNNNNTSSIA